MPPTRHFEQSTKIMDMFEDQTNLLKFLISSGHLPPHLGVPRATWCQQQQQQPMLKDRTERAWFRWLLRHPERKVRGSVLTTPEPAAEITGGTYSPGLLCQSVATDDAAEARNKLRQVFRPDIAVLESSFKYMQAHLSADSFTLQSVQLQCRDTVAWATRRASGL